MHNSISNGRKSKWCIHSIAVFCSVGWVGMRKLVQSIHKISSYFKLNKWFLPPSDFHCFLSEECLLCVLHNPLSGAEPLSSDQRTQSQMWSWSHRGVWISWEHCPRGVTESTWVGGRETWAWFCHVSWLLFWPPEIIRCHSFAFLCIEDPHFREHVGRESSSIFFGHTLISSQIIANHVFAEVKIITYYQSIISSLILEWSHFLLPTLICNVLHQNTFQRKCQNLFLLEGNLHGSSQDATSQLHE